MVHSLQVLVVAGSTLQRRCAGWSWLASRIEARVQARVQAQGPVLARDGVGHQPTGHGPEGVAAPAGAALATSFVAVKRHAALAAFAGAGRAGAVTVAGAGQALARSARRALAAVLLVALPRGKSTKPTRSAADAPHGAEPVTWMASAESRARSVLARIASISTVLMPASAREHAPVLAIAAVCAALLLVGMSIGPDDPSAQLDASPATEAQTTRSSASEISAVSAVSAVSGDAQALQEELARAQQRIQALEAENLLLTAIAQGMAMMARNLNARLSEAGFKTEPLPDLGPLSKRQEEIERLRADAKDAGAAPAGRPAPNDVPAAPAAPATEPRP